MTDLPVAESGIAVRLATNTRASISPWIFVISGLAALCIALLTISFQTIKTALINPAHTLRAE